MIGSNSKFVSWSIGAIVVIGLIVFYFSGALPQSKTPQENTAKPMEMRWLVAHEPTELFIKATEKFAEIFRKESGVELKLTVLGPTDVSSKLEGINDVSTHDVLELLAGGKVDIATTLSSGIGALQVPNVLEARLPYLFEDKFDGASAAFAALNGPNGQKLKDLISERTSNRAMAFTLSGGFRILISRKDSEISDLADFRGKKIVTTDVVGEKTLEELNAIPVKIKGEGTEVNDIDAIEVAYTRVAGLKNMNIVKNCTSLQCGFFIKHYPKNIVITETNHSLFFTTLLVRDSFYDLLSPQHRAAFDQAMAEAAKVEWDDSWALANKIKQDLKNEGIKIIEISPETQNAIKEKTRPVYDWFRATYGGYFIQ